MSPSPSVPEALDTLIERAIAADGQPPFSDQSLVERARGGRARGGGEHGAAIVGVVAREVELVVDPDARGRGLGTALAQRVLAAHPEVEFAWAHGDHPASRALAVRFGFMAVRALLQLRAEVTTDGSLHSLPEESASQRELQITPFRPGIDDAAWLALNARAFADHPEQGKLTQRDLDDRKAEDWFAADDFLILRDDDEGGEAMIGFCWLKVDGEIGEFYAVGIDPGRQGEGLGRVLMDAGLARLARRGIRTAALYVEADNAPALALYRRYGFVQHTVDVRYERR